MKRWIQCLIIQDKLYYLLHNPFWPNNKYEKFILFFVSICLIVFFTFYSVFNWHKLFFLIYFLNVVFNLSVLSSLWTNKLYTSLSKQLKDFELTRTEVCTSQILSFCEINNDVYHRRKSWTKEPKCANVILSPKQNSRGCHIERNQTLIRE